MKRILLLTLVMLSSLMASNYTIQEVKTNYALCEEFVEIDPKNKHINGTDCSNIWIPAYEYYQAKGELSGFKTQAEIKAAMATVIAAEKAKKKAIQAQKDAEAQAKQDILDNEFGGIIYVAGKPIKLKKKYWKEYEALFDIAEESDKRCTLGHNPKTGMDRAKVGQAIDTMASTYAVGSLSYEDVTFKVMDKSIVTMNGDIFTHSVSMSPRSDMFNFALKRTNCKAAKGMRMIFQALNMIGWMKTYKDALESNGELAVENGKIVVFDTMALQHPDYWMFDSNYDEYTDKYNKVHRLNKIHPRIDLYARYLNAGLASDFDEFSLVMHNVLRRYVKTDHYDPIAVEEMIRDSKRALNVIQFGIGKDLRLGLGDYVTGLEKAYKRRIKEAKERRDAEQIRFNTIHKAINEARHSRP